MVQQASHSNLKLKSIWMNDCFILFSELFDVICFENGHGETSFPLFSPY